MYNNKRIIVSMTSWKKRINNVSKVVYSLYKNSLCPDSIELNLSSDEFTNKEQDLPEDLLTLVAANILTINWVKEDTGVFKKFIPVLKKYPNEDFYLFSCDDDWLYNNNFISEMLKRLGNGDYFSLQNPRHVVGNSTVYKSLSFKEDFWTKITDELIKINVSDYYITRYLDKHKKYQGVGRHEKINNLAKSFNPCCPNSNYKKDGTDVYDMKRVNLAHKISDAILSK